MKKILPRLNLILCLLVVITYAALFYPKSNDLVFRTLDVGQGDALLLTLPGGHTILVDGGPDHSVVEKLGTYLPFWDRSIDLLILTHPHEDHLLGAVDVINTYDVRSVISNPVLEEYTASYRVWKKLLPTVYHMTPQEISMVRTANRLVTLDFFTGVKPSTNQNNNSIITLVTIGDVRMALMGDGEEALEKELVQNPVFASQRLNVLKVGHHGSKTSSSAEFIEMMHPSLGIISCGINNKFKHPNPSTLERLEQSSVRVLRTDQNGTITVTTDGKEIEVRTEKEGIT